ncbi:MAG: hypothetical protein J6N67_02725, partial [Desulfovibrio sp.]|nr:hypothetical protein [Desulfovibrio sp.]
MRTLFHRSLAALCDCLLCAAFWFSAPCRAAQPLRQPVEWTMMVYLCGDNNLEFPALMDLLEMEQALPEDVEIVVLLDRHRGYT